MYVCTHSCSSFDQSSRWFPLQDVQPIPEAQYLDCILYSREQLVKEYQAMPEKGDPEDLPQV